MLAWVWSDLVLRWACLVLGSPDLVMFWPGPGLEQPGLARPGLVCTWAGLGLSWAGTGMGLRLPRFPYSYAWLV